VWETEGTNEFAEWYRACSAEEQESINEAVAKLEEHGPSLGRPLVDTLSRTRLPNLKELRPSGAFIRILFAFDPRRVAILLIGGDKQGRWSAWYREYIPRAERLYEGYLDELRREGLLG
jgi:hypothetical protein